MAGTKVHYFTDRDVEFTDLLIKIGLPRTVATVLVFLANTQEASSRDIERGTDLRQPEVSLAMQYLQERDWVDSRLEKTESIGRPQSLFKLSHPMIQIIDAIQKEKEDEIKRKIDLTQKIRDYIQ